MEEPAGASATTEPAPTGGRGAPRTRGHWILLGATVAGVLGLVAARWVLTPDASGVGTHRQLGFPPCLPMELWNVPCPGCGVTTSVTHMSRGELFLALRNQPFGVAVWGAAVAFALWCWSLALRGKDAWLAVRAWNATPWLWAFGTVGVLSWIYKIVLVRGG